MRGSKWESVKPVLRTLQESFSSHIHTALLIKPDTFWQKHKTNLGSAKLSFEVSLVAAQLIKRWNQSCLSCEDREAELLRN